MRRLTGAVFLIGGLMSIPAFAVLGIPLARSIPGAVAGVVVGILVLLRPSPPIGSAWNQGLVVSTYGVPILAYYGSLPAGAAIAGAFTFSGVIIPFRLTERPQIFAHLTAVSALLLAPVLLGLANSATVVAVLILVPAIIALAGIVTVVLESAESQGSELETLARRDPLTGVGNRRLLSERLRYELLRHARNGRSFSLIAFDLNGFKRINDTLGHAAGDEVLIAVAGALLHSVRAQDTVVRQGGDEFCVLLPETSREDAIAIGDKLALAISRISAASLGVSSGVGVAEYPRDGTEIDPLLRFADDQLRAAKALTGHAR